jgi:branched-chain amino acid transport system permease protein
MLGAYMFYVFQTSWIPAIFQNLLDPLQISLLAIILAVIFVAFIGGVIYRLTIHPVLGDEVAVMVVTICLALSFQQVILVIFGTAFPPIGWPADSFLASAFIKILGVNLVYSRIVAFVAALALFGIMLLSIAKTKIGKAMRAVSQDREVAMLMGINTTRLYMLTMGISALLAAAASILIITSTGTGGGAWLWLHPLALSFAIVILGGLGSIKGSLIGGFIIGYAEQTVAFANPESGAIVGVVPLAIMTIVLLLRPKGLFGKRVEMEE